MKARVGKIEPRFPVPAQKECADTVACDDLLREDGGVFLLQLRQDGASLQTGTNRDGATFLICSVGRFAIVVFQKKRKTKLTRCIAHRREASRCGSVGEKGSRGGLEARRLSGSCRVVFAERENEVFVRRQQQQGAGKLLSASRSCKHGCLADRQKHVMSRRCIEKKMPKRGLILPRIGRRDDLCDVARGSDGCRKSIWNSDGDVLAGSTKGTCGAESGQLMAAGDQYGSHGEKRAIMPKSPMRAVENFRGRCERQKTNIAKSGFQRDDAS